MSLSGPEKLSSTWGPPQAFEFARKDYYLDRFTELRDRGLLGPARSVANAFRRRSVLTIGELESAIGANLKDRADEDAPARTERALSDLGFIWGTSPDPGWEPGIPSLMEYVLELAPDGCAGGAAVLP